jgi:hypothetical protein
MLVFALLIFGIIIVLSLPKRDYINSILEIPTLVENEKLDTDVAVARLKHIIASDKQEIIYRRQAIYALTQILVTNSSFGAEVDYYFSLSKREDFLEPVMNALSKVPSLDKRIPKYAFEVLNKRESLPENDASISSDAIRVIARTSLLDDSSKLDFIISYLYSTANVGSSYYSDRITIYWEFKNAGLFNYELRRLAENDINNTGESVSAMAKGYLSKFEE